MVFLPRLPREMFARNGLVSISLSLGLTVWRSFHLPL